MYGYEDVGRGQGRHYNQHRHAGDGACRREMHGQGSRQGGFRDMVMSKERLQDTLALLKDEKAAVENRIKDVEDLLKRMQD